MQHLVSVIQPGQRQWREESNRFLSHLVPPRLAVRPLGEFWTIGQDNVMGKSVIALKVIVTPRFHFECIFIGVRNKVDKQTMLLPFPGWQTSRYALPFHNGIAILNDRERYHAPQQYDPLRRYTWKTAAVYQAFSKVHR